ncbi:MAG: hypothetical protein ACRDZ8_20090 [Acidimicrobiales bacterium]
MIPGRGACSCPTCGAVCKGKFGGCSDVWAEGPKRDVTVRARASATNGGSVASGNGSSHQNGHSGDASRAAASGGTAGAGAAGAGAAVAAQLQDLSEQLSALNRLVETGRQDHPSDAPWEQNLAVMQQLHRSVNELPQAVAAALGDALGRQHQMVINDVRGLMREFLAELRRRDSAGTETA